jgi:tetratricopeptide (TPR) repeat protein
LTAPQGIDAEAAAEAAADGPAGEEHQRLAALMTNELQTNPDELRRARLHYELGTLYETQLGDLNLAAQHYRESCRTGPEFRPALRGARRVLAVLGRHHEMLPLFDAEARVTKKTDERAQILAAKGAVLEKHLGDLARAHEVYLQCHDLDEGNVAVLKALQRCQRCLQAWDELDRTYDWLANGIQNDPHQRAAISELRAQLAEARHNDPMKAASLHQAALSFDPSGFGALPALRRHERLTNHWQDLITVLQQQLKLTNHRGTRLMLFRRIAEIMQHRVGDQGQAIVAMELALQEAPEDSILLEQLSYLYESVQRFEALVHCLARLYEVTADSDKRRLLAYRIGRFFEQELNSDGKARAWYEASFATDPCSTDTMDALGNLYERASDWKGLIEMYLGHIGASNDDTSRALAHGRVGEIFEVHLRRPDEATAHHKQALGFDPNHETSLKALLRLHGEAHRWRELAELYELMVDHSTSNDRTIAFLFRMGGLHEDRLNDAATATHVYLRILQLDPAHLGAIQAVQRAAETAGEYRTVLEHLELEIQLADRTETQISLLGRSARLCERRLKDMEGAVARLRRVLKLQPNNKEALSSLSRLFDAMGHWDELLTIRQAQLQHAKEPEERKKLIHGMGEICEHHIGNEREAIKYYRQALKLDADFAPSYEALLRLLEAHQAWRELAELLEEPLPRLAEQPQRFAERAVAVARLYEDRLNNAEAALSFYLRALESLPTDHAAIDGRNRLLFLANHWNELAESMAFDAAGAPEEYYHFSAMYEQGLLRHYRLGDLASAANCFESVASKLPGHRGSLLTLEELYQLGGNRQGLADVYRRIASTFEDHGSRIVALRELGHIQRVEGVEQQAEATYWRLLELVENDEEALEALYDFARKRGDHEGTMWASTQLANAVEAPELAAVHLRRIAQQLESQGDNNALTAYRTALSLDQGSVGATRGFSRMARRVGDAEALREAARLESRITRDIAFSLKLYQEAAQIRLANNDSKGAVSDLAEALELAPDHRLLANYLISVLTTEQNFPYLVELLTRAAEATPDNERAAELYVQVAEVQANQVGNLPAAVAASQRALARSPYNMGALSRLAADLEQMKKWQEATEVLERIIALAREDEVQIEAHLRLATLLEDRLNQSDQALPHLNEVLHHQPDNPGALLRLTQLELKRENHRGALNLALRLVQVAPSVPDRVAALLQVAEINRYRGNHDEQARVLAETVELEGPNGNGSHHYAAMVKAGQGQASWEKYLRSLSAYLERNNSSQTPMGQTYRAIAQVLADQCRLPRDAVAMLRRGVEQDPRDVETRLHLAQRLHRLGEHDQAIVELRALLQEDARVADAWRELSQVLHSTGEAKEAALAAQPLLVLGAASPEEQETLIKRRPLAAHAPPDFFTPERVARLRPNSFWITTTELVQQLAPVWGKLYPADTRPYGVSRRDRLTSRSTSALRDVAERIAESLGVQTFELYVHQRGDRDVSLELGMPATLMVPQWASELPEPALVFLLARPLFYVSNELTVVPRLEPRELGLMLAGAAVDAVPHYKTNLASEQEVEERAKLIARHTPRRMRKSIRQAATEYAASAGDLQQWLSTVEVTAARLALLLADDVVSALEVLERRYGGKTDDHDLAGELLRFWVSDVAFRMRRELTAQQ